MPILPINLDLLSVGIAVAGIGILGFVVFFSDRKSITNVSFLGFAVMTVIWGISNYFNYQFISPELVLWTLRAHLCISVLHAYFFFQLAYVFPLAEKKFSKVYKVVLLPAVALVAILTLTPLVFSGIEKVASAGQVTNPTRGPAIILFVLMAVYLIGGGIFLLFRKLFQAKKEEKAQYRFVIIGTVFTFLLILTFNLVLPIFFNQLRFAPLGAIFIFPFIAFTAYAIFKHHLLSVKVISTEILAFILAVVTFSEVVLSTSFVQIMFRSGELILVLIFGIYLIQSVLREVEQREELERLNKQIEEQNVKLEELSHFKSELLSLASHQIRSPLAAIKGFGTLIVDGSYGPVPDKVKEAVEKMGKSANELIGLINTLLDLRKVEEGKMEYQFAKTDLNKLTTEVLDLLKPLAEAKKLIFTLDAPGHEVWVNADGEKLKQVIQNLTDNAIKYTPSGEVRVELKEEGGAATVSVKDSGVGVPASLLPHLFEEFIRDERVKKQILGTGLGLYIARKIAEAHGGKIWAESEGEGKGSTFRVSVPLMK